MVTEIDWLDDSKSVFVAVNVCVPVGNWESEYEPSLADVPEIVAQISCTPDTGVAVPEM